MNLNTLVFITILIVCIAFIVQSEFFMSSSSSSSESTPMSVTSTPLRFFLLGATGRTGQPFLSQALERGHDVTVYVRSASKLPASLQSHPRLHTYTGELDNTNAVAQALHSSQPHVIYAMLASDPAPHTAISTGTHSTLEALKRDENQEWIKHRPIPFISIAGWGLGPRMNGQEKVSSHVCSCQSP